MEHLEDCEHGLRITLPASKGDRAGKGVAVGIPYGSSRRALPGARAAPLAARGAGITEGPVFRRIWATPRPANPAPDWTPTLVVGTQPIDPGTVARIVKAISGAAAGFGAARAERPHPQARRDEHTPRIAASIPPGSSSSAGTPAMPRWPPIEEGDLFEDNALNGVL